MRLAFDLLSTIIRFIKYNNVERREYLKYAKERRDKPRYNQYNLALNAIKVNGN